MRPLALAVLALLAATAPAAAAPPCGPAGARTLVANKQARVFVKRERVRLCARGHRPVRWGKLDRDDAFGLAGRWVSFHNGYWAFVVDPRTGAIAAPGLNAEGERVLLSDRGGLAVQRGGEIRQEDGCGEQLLDEHADGGSLTLAGDRLRWTRAGAVREARLCPSGEIGARVCRVGLRESVAALTRWGAVVDAYRRDGSARTYVCSRRGRHLIAKSPDAELTGTDVYQLTDAGEWFAWAHQNCWKSCELYAAVAYNARTGERHRLEYGTSVSQLAVNRAGTMAGVFVNADNIGPFGPTKLLARSTRAQAQLAEGEVDADSLRIDATNAYWRVSGVEHSAPLPE